MPVSIDRASYCFDIHHTLSLKFYNGITKLGPCCLADHIDLEHTTVQEFWNHDYLVNLRNQNSDSKIPYECRACSKLEHAGLHSRRSNHLQYYTDEELTRPGVRMFDIHLPNLCNLRCTICGPYDSSSWHEDAKLLGLELKDEWRYSKDIQYNVKNLELPSSLEWVKFWGGEPLLTELHADFLELLDQQGLLAQIRLMYNTNGTVKVSDRVLKLWEKARLIEVWFSIDDIGDRFEYQRYGANWSQVTDIMQWYHDHLPHNHLMYISCSYGRLNIWSLPDVVEWHRTHFQQSRFGDDIKLVFNPVLGVCGIDQVSKDFYQRLAVRYQNYPELQTILASLQPVAGYQPKKFLDYVARLDAIRQTDFFRTFPEYHV